VTAQQFIDDALVDIGVIAAGETPTTEERDYALRLINQVLDNWSAEALPIYQITRETVVITGAPSYSLATRPVKIKSAQITGFGLTTPVKVVMAEEWSAGGGTQAMPHLWHDGGYPSGTVYLRPAPTGGSLELQSYRPFSTFATLSTSIAFPPGYELALRRALGLELAHGFGRPITPELAQLANNAKMSIQGLNAAVLGPPSAQEPAEQAA
jgi:hypothetical protein